MRDLQREPPYHRRPPEGWISHEYLGVGRPRTEDERLLRGRGCYAGDIRLPGMLHAGFVRSPVGKARLGAVAVEHAQSQPGAVAVFTAATLPQLSRQVPSAFSQPNLEIRMPPALASGTIRFAGEAVAVVVAETRYQLADAVEAVEFDLEPQEPVTDPIAARHPEAPLVHDDVPGNLGGVIQAGFGDIAGAFREADVVIRDTFRAERAAGAAMEPQALTAAPEANGGLTLWASTQAPHALRRLLAQFLDLPAELVRVITPDVGGGFGPKGRLYPEQCVLASISRALGRPISWQASRSEDLAITYQGRGAVVQAELAASKDGTLLGLRADLVQDCGAYLATGLIVAQNSAQHLLGPYRLPAASLQMTAVYTNKAPLSPLRGGGRELGVFVIERMIDRLAMQTGLDPVELRERNALAKSDFPYDTGYPSRGQGTIVYDSGDFPHYLRRACDLIGYREFREQQASERSRGSYRGIAVTLFIESTGLDRETAIAELQRDGSVLLSIGSPSNGQSHATTMPQIFAEYLGLPPDRIHYRSGDTGVVDQGTGTFGSRTAVIAGNAAAGAGRALREQILHAAADELEAAREDLEIVHGAVMVKGVPHRSLSFEWLAGTLIDRGTLDPLTAVYEFAPPRAHAFAGGAHAAIIRVDPETGLVHVERYVVVHDCGTVINPMVVEGQIHGGVAHGWGNVAGERMVYEPDTARLVTDSFQRYVMPIAELTPRIEIEHCEQPTPFNPEGIKGAGEGGTIGALDTILAAVEDALAPAGIELRDLPLNFDSLWRYAGRLDVARPGAESS
ncbi:MAG TPA: xanthine dehydrogenase family protein molybdopterin-binding subunit [Chloroflexota bacterium]|nr:xanthine dehydrogenase family protein molybdopterin-binding subunit [Chloroflexota bacterium]